MAGSVGRPDSAGRAASREPTFGRGEPTFGRAELTFGRDVIAGGDQSGAELVGGPILSPGTDPETTFGHEVIAGGDHAGAEPVGLAAERP